MRRNDLNLFLLTASLACSSPPEWHDVGSHRWRELRIPARGGAGFTRVEPSRTRIDFANVLDTELALDNEHLLIGSGVALGDVDGDGLTDIYLTRLQGPNAIYRNRGGWRFEDISAGSGVEAADRFSTGAAMADVDGDGALDLVVTSLAGPDVVYRNDGSGRFTAVANSGLIEGLGSTTVTLADVEGDGDLDLFVAAYKAQSASDVFGMLARSQWDIVDGRKDSLVVAPEFLEHYRIEERGGMPVVTEQAEPDRLYLNDGTGRFAPVSWTDGGFVDEEGRPLERDLDDFALSARFYDVDGDGDPDLYVCNDFDDPDQLWMNQGDGTFRAAPRFAMRTSSHASMSVDFADIDRDGDVDFFVAEMRTRDPGRRLAKVPFHKRLRKPVGVMDDRPQIQRNTLFLNRGHGSFAEIAELAEVDASDWTWTSMFVDVDLDGFEDLLVANGYSRDTQHGDVVDSISALQGHVGGRELKRLYPSLPNRNVAFRNRGDLSFRDVGSDWGFGTEKDVSHGMAAGDLDGDGDLDVVVNRLEAPVLVLRNDAVAPRVAVRLSGTAPNTRGIGAKVRLIGGPVEIQEREMTAGGLYLSGSAPELGFASGDADSMILEVDWPGGARTIVQGVRPNRLYEVREAPAPGARDGRAADGGDGEDSAPLFVDRSDVLGHRHAETDFEDYRQQPLLPYQPSRLGPGVSWIDVDGDGDPDLVIPPGAGGRLGYLRNDGGRFNEVSLESAPSPFDRTAALGLPGRDGPLLVVGQSNYEAASLEDAEAVPAVLGIDLAKRSSAPTPLVARGYSATGPLAAADVDGDASLELFLGGRIVKGLYPLSASSRLFAREGDKLVVDLSNEQVLEEIGLVSGAVFSDVDADGDPDLALATEWGPVRLLVNDGGRLTDATGAWGLDDLEGRWNGIAAGDLDADGRMDLVVTGWGRNVRHRPRDARPLVLYHGDLDRNGTWDLVLTQADRGSQVLRTLVDYPRMRVAVPSLRSRLPTFESYAEADLESVLGSGDVYGRTARHYDHLLLLNRGERFDAVPLPLEAQFAASMGVTVGDLNGDGKEDVFLSQNFFPTHLFMPRHDAGLGLVLLGDGRGGLMPLPVSRSGVRIHGDQRGAALADYDEDGRIDLAVAQNGAATRLFRNAGARPGLRVRLVGPEGNPEGIGSVLRIVYAGRVGPAREVHAGSGYWSVDHAVQVLGLESEPLEVLVRWPGGTESRVPVPEGARTVTVRMPAS
jgi:hypothetical protein